MSDQIPNSTNQAQIEQEPESNDLILASRSIFGQNMNTFALSSGKTVEIKPARMGQLTVVTSFFEAIVKRIDPKQLAMLIHFTAELQKEAISEGRNPFEIDMSKEIFIKLMMGDRKEKDAEQVASVTMNQAGLLIALVNAVLSELPKAIPAFTNLTQGEFENLDPDEGMLVVGSIFMVNYSFFTQRMLPILREFAVSTIRARIQEAEAGKSVEKKSG